MMMTGVLAITAGCGQKKSDFKYLLDEFADLKVMRYTIPGWEELTLQQKEYAYHLAEAAKWGRDIHWDQNCKWNLPIRHVVENILENYKGDRTAPARSSISSPYMQSDFSLPTAFTITTPRTSSSPSAHRSISNL